MRKVIYHVDETEKWPLTAGNITNMLENYRSNGVEYQIEVVANGESVLEYGGLIPVCDCGSGRCRRISGPAGGWICVY